MTTTYRSSESQFLQDLGADMEPFKNFMPETDFNEDCTAWYSAIKKQLDHHALLKSRRVKSKRLPEWFNKF